VPLPQAAYQERKVCYLSNCTARCTGLLPRWFAGNEWLISSLYQTFLQMHHACAKIGKQPRKSASLRIGQQLVKESWKFWETWMYFFSLAAMRKSQSEKQHGPSMRFRHIILYVLKAYMQTWLHLLERIGDWRYNNGMYTKSN